MQVAFDCADPAALAEFWASALPGYQLQPPPTVAQRDCDRALGIGLADDEAVELGNDFAGREVGHVQALVATRIGQPAIRAFRW